MHSQTPVSTRDIHTQTPVSMQEEREIDRAQARAKPTRLLALSCSHSPICSPKRPEYSVNNDCWSPDVCSLARPLHPSPSTDPKDFPFQRFKLQTCIDYCLATHRTPANIYVHAYVYVCICIHAQMYTHVHTCTHTCTPTNTSTYSQTDRPTYMHM